MESDWCLTIRMLRESGNDYCADYLERRAAEQAAQLAAQTERLTALEAAVAAAADYRTAEQWFVTGEVIYARQNLDAALAALDSTTEGGGAE